MHLNVQMLKRLAADIGGDAAIELALVLPVLLTMTVITVDLGSAFLQQNEIVSALAAGAHYAQLAIQQGTAIATIQTNTPKIVAGASNSLLTTAQVTVLVNNGDATTTDTCCISGGSGGTAITWNCGALSSCPDQSIPGTYIQITASTTFTPYFGMDKTLAGASVGGTVIERIQ